MMDIHTSERICWGVAMAGGLPMCMHSMQFQTTFLILQQLSYYLISPDVTQA